MSCRPHLPATPAFNGQHFASDVALAALFRRFDWRPKLASY